MRYQILPDEPLACTELIQPNSTYARCVVCDRRITMSQRCYQVIDISSANEDNVGYACSLICADMLILRTV